MSAESIGRGTFVRLDATGETGRIGNRGSRGWWFGGDDDSGWYVHASDVTPLEGEELRDAETSFAARRAVAMG